MIAKNHNLRNVPGARKVFGLLLALWVSLAIQPCAVAAVSEHDCPHCPTEIEAAPESQHHHGHAASANETGQAADCGATQADCCELVEGIASVRVDSPEPDDEIPAITSAPPPGVLDAPRARPALAVPLPQLVAARVPLHIIKCVYLI